MKVRKLIALLQEQDPEAEVRLMVQQHYPFEDDIAGVVMRDEFTSVAAMNGAKVANDVFILDGEQITYGSRKAWEV